jgi:hypothetical protein
VQRQCRDARAVQHIVAAVRMASWHSTRTSRSSEISGARRDARPSGRPEGSFATGHLMYLIRRPYKPGSQRLAAPMHEQGHWFACAASVLDGQYVHGFASEYRIEILRIQHLTPVPLHGRSRGGRFERGPRHLPAAGKDERFVLVPALSKHQTTTENSRKRSVDDRKSGKD